MTPGTELVTVDRPIPVALARPYLKLVFAHAAARDLELGDDSPGHLILADAAWLELVAAQPGGERERRARLLLATTPRFYDDRGVLSPLELLRYMHGREVTHTENAVAP